jgi:hypothetical protein
MFLLGIVAKLQIERDNQIIVVFGFLLITGLSYLFDAIIKLEQTDDCHS